MEIINKPYFKCSHCGKIFSTKASIVNHEKYCKRNPHNITLCLKCGWAIVGQAEGYRDVEYYDGVCNEHTSTLLMYCVKHKSFMSARNTFKYADGITCGNCKLARYKDEGCDDFTTAEEVPGAYELGANMSTYLKLYNGFGPEKVNEYIKEDSANAFNPVKEKTISELSITLERIEEYIKTHQE